MSTKKVKGFGRYGARYGVGIRKRTLKIEAKQKAEHNCPNCSAPRVKRKAAGIFECRKCGFEFAGGAYFPETMSGTIVKKMVMQKSFLPNVKELVEAPIEKEAEEEKPNQEKEAAKPVSKTAKKKKHKKESKK